MLEFHADFFLFGNIGLERFVGITHAVNRAADGSSGIGGVAFGETFHIVAVHRYARRDAVQYAESRTDPRFFVFGSFRTGVVGEVFAAYLLPAGAESNLQAFVEQAQGVAQSKAGELQTASNGGAVHIVAAKRGTKCRFAVIRRVVQIGGKLVAPVHDVGVFARGLEAVECRRPFVLHRAGGEFAAQADFAGVDFVAALVVEAVERAVAVITAYGKVGQRVALFAAAQTVSGISGKAVIKIVFAAQGTKPVALVGIAPRLSPV